MVAALSNYTKNNIIDWLLRQPLRRHSQQRFPAAAPSSPRRRTFPVTSMVVRHGFL